MALDFLMLIRHGERPRRAREAGVAEDGSACPHSLSVAGWQRAGALVPLFRQLAASAPALAVPTCLYACPATAQAPSRRSVQTLGPLARALGLEIDTTVEKQDESRLAACLQRTDGVALVAWSHQGLPALARAYLADSAAAAQVPAAWPKDRFDLLWIIDGPSVRRRLQEVGQDLLAGDGAPTGRAPTATGLRPREET
ncbi:hypothetical protein GCM10007320_29570 [Pseudorhodoferax aquiterrae]|uniref:Histidine phosphatase family protein n=1 Tax=Pseudorhodoferax aquiterrae TaxID=747304 RepID=A0ABQ3G2X2_9BURK|nr:hypothetical protein [Pseudorhodoferax aquiterrae]GHC84959.1 hypothetical protein GCM10007320_29570 [Pseudorhodoferax aquiterrae]